uniref:Uncharacterized protein n=1 Tax=Aegilops tauschii subsp. strangulata TaxID=200361 RepID=A0A453IQV4_AEGTS
MTGEDAVMAAAASSECSSGCQSGWTTYLDDDTSSYSRGGTTARLHGGKGQRCRSSCRSEEAEEDDLSMISDASSGPRQQYSAGSDEGAAALANAQRAERRCRAKEPAAARRQSKMVAAVASTLLEDTASSPAFFKHSKVRTCTCLCSPICVPFFRVLLTRTSHPAGDGLPGGQWLRRRGRVDDGIQQCSRLLLHLLLHDGLRVSLERISSGQLPASAVPPCSCQADAHKTGLQRRE